jgi:cbb3-type cytochrome oxidase cytochrome c subunit
MSCGPLVFLAAFFAFAASWFGLVLAPQFQIGRLQQETNVVNTTELYPSARPGLARQGLEVYRAAGCTACHTEQVGQTGTVCDVVLTDAGTNHAALIETLIRSGLGRSNPGQYLSELPKPVRQGLNKDEADFLATALKSAGAKADVRIVPVGPDIARGWGKRRTVAEDYLYDDPVMLGSLRVGPDLANVGVRLPDPNWHLRHLYAPRLEVKDSPMPPYRYLFTMRRIGWQPSPDALQLPGEFAPPPGFEIVPKPEARALVAYLSSLRTDAVLFEAPMTAPSAPAAATATNTPAK